MKKSVIIGSLLGLIFGISFIYTLYTKAEIRTYQDVDFVAYCTIQVELYTEEFIHYKTVENYPVHIYEIETSRYGHMTYMGYANNRYLSIDSSACKKNYKKD